LGLLLQFNCEESPNVVAEEIIIPEIVTLNFVEEMKEEYGETSPLYQSRVKGEFPEEGENQLIPLSWVERSMANDSTEDGRSSLFWDVARGGGNYTVFAMMQGSKLKFMRYFNNREPMQIAGQAVKMIKKEEPDVYGGDDTGLSGGVNSRLREQGFAPVSVNFQATPSLEVYKKKFVNLRAWMYWKLREDMEDNKISLLDDDGLRIGLVKLKYEFRSESKIKIIDKEKIKSDLPPKHKNAMDFTDAVVMANWGREFGAIHNREKNKQYFKKYCNRFKKRNSLYN